MRCQEIWYIFLEYESIQQKGKFAKSQVARGEEQISEDLLFSFAIEAVPWYNTFRVMIHFGYITFKVIYTFILNYQRSPP